jgi:hypothetical protein
MTVAVELPTIQLRVIRPQGWATQAVSSGSPRPSLLGAAGTLAGRQLLVPVQADDAATGGVGAAATQRTVVAPATGARRPRPVSTADDRHGMAGRAAHRVVIEANVELVLGELAFARTTAGS